LGGSPSAALLLNKPFHFKKGMGTEASPILEKYFETEFAFHVSLFS